MQAVRDVASCTLGVEHSFVHVALCEAEERRGVGSGSATAGHQHEPHTSTCKKQVFRRVTPGTRQQVVIPWAKG